ncbi:MAG: FHA domain-containing protein [Verrucomicrobiota bacterium]
MSSPTLSLIVSISGQEPARHDLTGDVVSIGRGPDNEIQVLVSEVSVKHAEIKTSPDGATISDTGSTNGTRLNGAAIGSEPVAIHPMEKLLLGSTIPAYVVATGMLESASMEELIEKIDASAENSTAPVAVAVGASPVLGSPAPATAVAARGPASPGGVAPVKPGPVAPLNPAVRPGAPAAPGGPVRPPAPAAPAPAAAAQGPATVRLEQVKPNDSPAAPGPVTPSPVKPGQVAPASPVTPAPLKPSGAPPVAPIPLQQGGPGGAAPPSVPLPAKKKPPR